MVVSGWKLNASLQNMEDFDHSLVVFYMHIHMCPIHLLVVMIPFQFIILLLYPAYNMSCMAACYLTQIISRPPIPMDMFWGLLSFLEGPY